MLYRKVCLQVSFLLIITWSLFSVNAVVTALENHVQHDILYAVI